VRGYGGGVRRSGENSRQHKYTKEQISSKNSHNNRSRVYKTPR